MLTPSELSALQNIPAKLDLLVKESKEYYNLTERYLKKFEKPILESLKANESLAKSMAEISKSLAAIAEAVKK
jgi:hypothetical protein